MMRHICKGGLKAQLYRTAQGKRSDALGSHSIPANRHSRPARAGSVGKKTAHSAPAPNPHTYGVLCLSSSNAYQACVEQSSPHTWLPNITPMGVNSLLILATKYHPDGGDLSSYPLRKKNPWNR